MYIKRILLGIVLLGLLGLGVFSYFVYNTLLTPNTNFEEDHQYVYIKTNSKFGDVMEQLSPLLIHPDKFEITARQKKYNIHIKPGRYKLTKGMSNNDLINALRSGNEPVSIIFNNQDRLEFLAGRISHQIEADSLELYQAMTDPEFLKENNFTKETALNMYVPNKYQFYWNTSAADFRNRMLTEYQRFWNEKRISAAEALGMTPSQVQTMASIVQKETARVDERPRVAGVYMNRYKIGMKLDADPTVIYALKNKETGFDTITIKRVLYKDLEFKSPYNTYLNVGLPPGPISMPDISSVDAVLNYEKHDFFYFVSDPSNPGYHKFAKTLSQHNANRNEYIKWINKLKIKR